MIMQKYLNQKNIDVNELNLQEDEIQDAKWVEISEFERLIEQEKASDTGFCVFKNYYDNFYKRYIEFVDGKPILKKVEDNNSI